MNWKLTSLTLYTNISIKPCVTHVPHLTSIVPLVYHLKLSVRTTVNLSYKIFGNNPADNEIPTLLLHDFLSSKRHWEGLGKTIVAVVKKPVVVVDLRNHGDSPNSNTIEYKNMANDLLKLIKKIGTKKATFIGHGLGGMVAMYLAITNPKVVAGLLVVDISPVSTTPEIVLYYTQLLSAMKEIDLKGVRNLKEARKLIRKKLKPLISDDDVLDVIVRQIRKSDRMIVWKWNLDVFASNLKRIIIFPKKELRGKTYNGPVLFIGGQKSDYLPPDDLPGIRGMFPQAVVTYINACGHQVHNDDTQSFLEYCIQFIKTNDEYS